MRTYRAGPKMLLVAALVAALSAAQGCTEAQRRNYLMYRVEDWIEMVDIGVTASIWPGFAFYLNGVSVSPFGIGYVDGYFLGVGGGQIGFTQHYEKSIGLLVWGYEEVGWRSFDKGNKATLDRQFVGVLGILLPPYRATPAYMPACVHYFHLGWLGVVGNLRYMEMVDFLLGWTTLDIAGDDGYKLSKWPWNRRTRPEPG